MAVATLGTSGSASGSSVANSYAGLSYTVSAGSERLLLLFVSIGDVELLAPTAVTYGGQAMTQIPSYKKNNGVWTLVDAWYLKEAGIAAASGSTFSLTFTGIEFTHFIVGSQAFSGVDQTTPLGTAVSASGTSTAPSTGSITCPSNGLVVGSVCTDDDNAFSQGSTLIFEIEGVGSDTGGGAQSRATTGALAWTTDNQGWAVAGVPLNASGGAVLPGRSLRIEQAVNRAATY